MCEGSDKPPKADKTSVRPSPKYIFRVKDFQVGVTAPSFHVWCRSCTAPRFEDADDVRVARDADGKTYYVPADMKYKNLEENVHL